MRRNFFFKLLGLAGLSRIASAQAKLFSLGGNVSTGIEGIIFEDGATPLNLQTHGDPFVCPTHGETGALTIDGLPERWKEALEGRYCLVCHAQMVASWCRKVERKEPSH